MPVKMTFLFNGGRNGWSESFYSLPSVIDLEGLMDAAEVLSVERRQMLAPEYRIDAIRLSDTSTRGGSFLRRLPNAIGLAQDSSTPRDVKENAMLCRIEGVTGLYKRPWLVRGCPDSWFDYNTDFEREPVVFTNRLKAFSRAAKAAALAIRCIARDLGPDAQLKRDIVDVDFTGAINAPFVSINAPNHGLIAGSIVRIRNALFVGPTRKPIDGLFRVVPVTLHPLEATNWFSIDFRPTAAQKASLRWFNTGTWQTQGIHFERTQDPGFFFERFTQRKTGSAFFRGRGRSRGLTR